jgi:DNA-binding beta-propeller fold protein YncE
MSTARIPRVSIHTFAFASALALAAAACAATDGAAAGSSDGGWGGGGTDECLSSSECPTGWTCSEFGTCQPPTPQPDGGTEPLPEEEEYDLGAPVSSLRFVYVAMTALDSLAKIDGRTLAVSSLPVGERPKVVVSAPGTDTVVVLDSVNGTATVVRPTVDRDERTVLGTLPRLNRLVIDPTGRYAVSWFDFDQAIADAGGIDNVELVGSYQDVTIIDLTPGDERSVDLTVGFRPRAVAFDAAGTRAYVITQDGVSVIDLAEATGAGPAIVPPISITGDPFTDPSAVEVAVVASGVYAVVREAGASHLRILRLTGSGAGQSWVVPLPSPPSDVDLSPDGARAYVTLRESAQLAVIDVPGGGLDPESVEYVDLDGELVGSLVLSRDGDRGLLFTNAFLEKRITVIALDEPGYPHQTFPLQKAVRWVHLSPAGDSAVIVHAKAPGDPGSAGSFEEFLDRSFGYSVFDLATGFAKLQLTPVDPGGVAFAPAAPRAYIALDGGDAEGAVAQLHSVALDTGVVRVQKLGSPPDAVGVLPGADVAYVNQRHPLGRVSFIDIETGTTRTITGFDLNSRIID